MSFNALFKWANSNSGETQSGGGFDALSQWSSSQSSQTDKPRAVDEIDEDVVPFGALGVTKDGMPYYGEGLHGWIRKTYGDLFDPAKRLNNPSDRDFEKYQGYANKFSNLVEDKFNYDAWGEKVFGLSAKEAGNVLASIVAPGAINKQNLDEQVEAGEITKGKAALEQMGAGISNAANMTKDFAQRGIWGALEILGLTDVGMRKLGAVRLGLDDLADKYGEPDEGGFWSNSIFNLGGQVKDALTIGKAIASGEASVDDLKKPFTENPYWRGSNAMYTLAADEAVRREFQTRVRMGEDAGEVAAELARPGLEFAGSVLGDPATYLGMGLFKPSLVGTPMKLFGKQVKVFGVAQRVPWQKVGKIPTFGELVGLTVAGQRLSKAADNHFFSYANDEMARLMKNAFDSGDEVATTKLLDEAVRKVVRPGEVAAEQGQKIVKTGIGDLASQSDEVRKLAVKNQYKVTSFTADGKTKLLARNVSLVMDMVYGGSRSTDEALETLQDMVRMQNGATYDERLLAAKRLTLKGSHLPDGTVTGHGALLFSEAGIMTGDMLSRLDPNKLDDIFAKYGDDPTQFGTEIFKALDGAFKSVFPSVDEMYDAKKAVRAGEAALDKVELARKYDELPAHVKATSSLHRKLSKVQGPAVGLQVNLYMRWSPGYAARNIFGQGAGIALDMGLGRAVRTSIDAFWKPLVSITSEALGKTAKVDPYASHIAMRAGQVVDATGVAPDAIRKAIGMAEVKDAKGFNALNFAQKGEAMTAADIVADTIFDEIHKALPAVMSGDGSVKHLVDSGILNEKQANLLTKFLTDNDGNTSKAVDAFKRSVTDAKVESWRHIPLPQGMRDLLRKSGDLGDVQRLQEEAKSLDEFQTGVKGILQNIYDAVKKNVSNETASLDSNVPDELREVADDILDLFNDGLLDDMEADIFTRKIQAWQNVRSKLEESSRMLERELYKMSTGNTSDFTNGITAVSKKFDKTYGAVSDVRTMTRKMVDGLREGSVTPEQAFSQLRHSNIYDIKAMFPDVDPTRISQNEAIERIWSGYFQFSSDHWRNANNAKYTETMGIFQEWAKANGTTLDEIAALHNLENDPLRMLQKAYNEANIIEQMGNPSLDKFKDVAGATLHDMMLTGDQVDASGKAFTKTRIFNTVNAERKAQGLAPYASHADVPWKEAQNAMKTRMGRWATPAEVVKKVNDKLGKGQKIKKIALSAETGLDELPAPVLEKVQMMAKKMLDEMGGGQVEKLASGQRIGSSNVEWWQSASKGGAKRDAVEKALQKIVEGKDSSTANVKRVKDMIFDRLRYGDPITGTPPDLYALEQLGADNKTMQAALDDFNEITKNKFDLQEAIDASMPADEAMARTADMPFYNDKGQLIQPKKYARIQDIPEEMIKGAVEPNRIPPPMNDEYITTARAYWENMDGFMEDAAKWTDEVSGNWGKLDDAGELPQNIEDSLSKWKNTVDDRMRVVKDKSLVIASMKRDFLLHDYNKTYADVALGYLMPFSYWHTRTYARWAERLVDQPKWGSMYLAYKRKMEKEHADAPEWWRQNVGIKIPGINHGNPIFLNLEATLNPLNGLTGVDFNDPYKRVDWLSKTVDDMGKMGPAFTAPLNWAMALYLFNKGEDEAAKRWAGRLIPQTMQIKGILTKAGADINAGPFIKHNEFDPFVNFTSDGLDPYELNRVNRHLAQLVENEMDPEARQLLATQAIDAARTHSGPLWDQARENAINERAGGQVASYLLGVGFKPRNEEDMKVDKFYGEYFKLLKLRDNMTPEEYRASWDRLRDQYVFADALIIGKKADPERDSAFTYNVLGRIPPGQMGDLFEQVGLTNDDINRFYSNKGDFKEWTEGDQKRFMAAVVDLSAILQMPQLATRQEWNQVKTNYSQMKDAISKQMGDDIWEKVDAYYALKNEARYKGNAYLHDHPEVSQALDMQTQMTVGNPLVYKYYGSLNTLQSYYNGEVRKELEAKYGDGIYEQYYAYLDAVDPDEKKRLNTAALKQFMKEKNKMKDPVTRAIVDMANRLPNRPTVEYRADLTAPSAAQQGLIDTLNIQTNVDPQVLWQNASPALFELVTSYWANGDDLPYAARSNLDYLAEQFGISGDEALQLMGMSLNQ